jgi:hypothetical protein
MVQFAWLITLKNAALLANGAKVRQILGHKFGKFGCTVWERVLVKLNNKFYFQIRCNGVFSLGIKVW